MLAVDNSFVIAQCIARLHQLSPQQLAALVERYTEQPLLFGLIDKHVS